MPHFFIDTSDGVTFVRDETGFDFVDIETAKEAAVRALPGMAKDVLPCEEQRTFLVVIRNGAGGPLLQATLALTITPLMPERES